MIKSDRGFPLLIPSHYTLPLITVELYEKWYSLYIVKNNLSIEKVNSKYNFLAWADHCLIPKYYPNICREFGIEYNDLVLELIIGRYYEHILEDPLRLEIDYE